MKKLSDDAFQIVDALDQLDKKTGWFGRPRECSDIVANLIELSLHGEPASIPCICRFLFSKDLTVRTAAAEAIATVLFGLDSSELLQLSDAFNWEYGWYAGQSWNNLSPSKVRSLAEAHSGKSSVALLGLLSFHRSGYVREEAVKLLCEKLDGTEVPFLLIRQNDWVGAVSHRAQTAIRERLVFGYSEHLFDNIALIAHLPEFGRTDLSHVTDATFSQLLTPQHQQRLQTLLQSRDRKTVRRFVKRSFEFPGDHAERVARLGLDSSDVVVRLWSARVLLAASPHEILIEQLLQDRFAPVRREAYEAKVARDQETAVTIWIQAAFDRSRGIRDLARYHLRKQRQISIRELYKERLLENADNLNALMGLSECATQTDMPLLREYSKHKAPSRRRAAIAGLVRVQGEAIADALVGWLADDSPVVAKQAARSLRDFPNAANSQQLFAVLQASTTNSGRLTCLRLFYEMGKWKSLPWLIRAFALEDVFVSEHAELLARDWLLSNSVFTKPSESEQRSIVQAFAEARDSVPDLFVEELKCLLPFPLAISN